MSLSERLFPEERRPRFVQTEWSTDWTDTFLGIGYLTAWITENIDDLGALVDHAGPAVVYLQRHRVEVGLKALLAFRGAEIRTSHRLDLLWEDCRDAVKSDWPDEWAALAAEQQEFVMLLDGIDRRSTTFRYPVDGEGNATSRPKFIDLQVLEEQTDAFEASVMGLVSLLEVSQDYD